MKKARPQELPFLSEVTLFEEGEIFSTLAEKKGTSLFLGRYSLNQVAAVLKKKNFFKDAQKRRLWPLDFDLDSTEFPLQRFRIFYKEKKAENMIVDLKIKEGVYQLQKNLALEFPLSECNFLFLEWLTLQNPLLSFSEKKTSLPGQKHPGLNLGKKVLNLFVYLARINHKDGIFAFPAYFHNSLLFSRYFYFINPKKTAEVLAIKKSFPEITFKQLAWIVHLGCMRERDEKEYEWKAEELVYPLNKTLNDYFRSKEYRAMVKEYQEGLKFRIDWECYEKKIARKSEVSLTT